ncbi:hypothetical protein VD0002_g4574 [Verticillium dahliae]|uniref:Developmental regulator n=2 Tax=Verticillium dahliae TaxID=27337 RepID=G2WQ25_VERDV|nr:uncharacterized protein VDAG_00467 [Verticillium dahliae VdLs.17]PNH34271.1 hypothetical protein BJF96_g2392 [Verticillium dahliae]EGY13785.1 hypothetical protein VDAG_00467 [Verticillium dahliae VdLs.17]PNH40293.1 hypothetical protein VD0004_g6677 [Verticillium dahliae]PNH56982.1 hypothetical protein VD0003_g824 [Verticillium dahliae]PNH63940.1 hypothetical protein VD0002_g4574 [Verticillium dahliae]
MPTYLCHGFRWHRPSIRVYVVVQNIDDAAPEWIIGPESSNAILESFYTNFDFLPEARPASGDRQQQQRKKAAAGTGASKRRNGSQAHNDAADPFAKPPPPVPPEEDDVLLNSWSAVKLLEEYDPTDLTSVSRPYAFVADHVVRVDLSVSVVEEMAGYEERMGRDSAGGRAMTAASSDDFNNGKAGHKKGATSGKKAGWLEKLRDQLQKGEDIRWYVVVCGDEERAVCEELLEAPREQLEPRHIAELMRQEPVLEPAMRSFDAPRGEGHRPNKLSMDRPPEGETRPRTGSRETRYSRDRSGSASKRVTGGYSPFPPPPSAAPPTHKKATSVGVPPAPTREPPPAREQRPATAHPQPVMESNVGVKTPHKSRSLRRLFGMKEGSS